MLLRGRFTQGHRRLTPGGGAATTDDRGEFRLFGLQPGRYYLVAAPRTTPPRTAKEARWGHAPTYYPGTANAGDAQPVTVTAGSTTDASLVLVRAVLVNVSGTVTDSDGRTASGGAVSVRADAVVGARAVTVAADGTFIVTGLSSGRYSLRSQDRSSGPGQAAGFSAATAVVGQEDVTGVVLRPVTPSTIRGRVVGLPRGFRALPASTIQVGAMPGSSDSVVGVQRSARSGRTAPSSSRHGRGCHL